MEFNKLSRRDFLKVSAFGLGVVTFRPMVNAALKADAQWPEGQKLGRVCVDELDVRDRPSADGNSVGKLQADDVVQWLKEVVGDRPPTRISRRWVETPNGYVYAPSLQPVLNKPNQPVAQLPSAEIAANIPTGKGMWVEVTVPYVDVVPTSATPAGYWLRETTDPRLYYSQVVWVDDMKTDTDGTVYYQVNERYGSRGDKLLVKAEAFRQITADEIAPINPDASDKKIVVDLTNEYLSCYEGTNEVYFCQVSAGINFDEEGNPIDHSRTPAGDHPLWRKLVSLHMEGGTAGGGYDLPGVAWTCLFASTGEAIHSTFWHNDFGDKRSHGCVNVAPDDAKWIFRWTTPQVVYDPGDLTISGPGGTIVSIIGS
jgi:lipoprotein-anchoring transpeptidase ErfK/SrfK